MKTDDMNPRDVLEDEKVDAEFHYEQSPFLKWLDNYWYHYKWPTIIISFFAIVLIVVIAQMVNRPKYDIVILLCKNYHFVYRRKITSLFISSTQQALKEKPT